MADTVPVLHNDSVGCFTPVRPRIVSLNIQNLDITNKFRGAASKLRAGTLVKDDCFTLFESVGALEIGDPKMDSGCIVDGELFEDDFDICKRLMPSEIVWLMDELISREVAWHMGYPLSQTLFTSVFIEKLLWPDPKRLDDAQFSNQTKDQLLDPLLHKVFRSYCLGLVKSCDLVLGMVTGQHYYEEEDFATQLYNRELLHRFPVNDILVDMESSLQYLESMTIGTKEQQSILSRLTFRLHFLHMLSDHAAGYGADMRGSKFDASLLSSIEASRESGIPVRDAFTLKIQRRLASTVPPRPMVTIDDRRTFDYLNRFIRDCDEVFSVLCAAQSHDLFTSYSIFCAQDPQPSVYVRALLQSWLDREDIFGSGASEQDFVVSDLRYITLAASPLTDGLTDHHGPLAQGSRLALQHFHDFVAKHSRSFYNIWRTVCLNRCRLRRTLCHAALEWDQIQADAEELDEELQNLLGENAVVYPVGGTPTFSYSVSSWVYHYKLMQLRLIVEMGIELDIYAPHELATMYWYLGHLCDTHLAHLERISFFVSQRLELYKTRARQSSSQSRALESCRTSLRHLYRQFSWLKATEANAMALHGLYTVLQRHGQMQQSTTTYASDSLRYELRMRPFSHLSIPEALGFEKITRKCLMAVRSDVEILDDAASHITMAKKGWEEVARGKWNSFPLRADSDQRYASIIDNLWTVDIRNALKATIGASIVITKIKAHLAASNSTEHTIGHATVPQPGDSDHWHAWWRVPRVTL